MDAVTVEVETVTAVDESVHSALQRELVHKLKETIGLSMAVELKAPQTIPRSQGGKLSRILDQR